MLSAATLHDIEDRVQGLQDELTRLLELHSQRGVEDVGARHALVEVAGRLTNHLTHASEEGDQVVLERSVQLVDAVKRKRLGQHWLGTLTTRDCGAFRHGPELLHRLTGEQLDLQHDGCLPLFRPDGRHFGLSVTIDHV